MDDFFKMIQGVFHGIEAYHDSYTKHHETLVGRLMSIFGKALGYSAEMCRKLEIVGDIHDIGKLTIPAAILEKPGKLSSYEKEVVKLHPQIGVQLIEKISHPFVEFAKTVILNHHEAFNGTGYPFGLIGEEIPLEARICSICDVYDALRSHRPYREKKFAHKNTLELMFDKTGEGLYHNFDPKLMDIFNKISAKFNAIYADSFNGREFLH